MDIQTALPYGMKQAARRIAQVNAGPRIPGDTVSMNHLVAGYQTSRPRVLLSEREEYIWAVENDELGMILRLEQGRSCWA